MSTPGSQTTSITAIDLNILTKFISKFDGNREKLNAFLNNCRNAIQLASQSQQDILFKFILSQLEGRAAAACSIKDFENWDQLENYLKEYFGEKKHYTHLLSELQSCKQGNHEPVSQFSLRVETNLSKLLMEINVSIPTKKKGELAGRVAAMEDLALHTFIMGLNPRLSTIVRCRDPVTLNDAVNFAISEEKISQNVYKSNQGAQFDRAPRPREQTYKPSSSVNAFQPLAITSSGQSSNIPTCRYCKLPGHTIEKCRKREFNNSRRQNFTLPRTFVPSGQTNRPTFNTRNVSHVEEVHLDTPGYDDYTVESADVNTAGNLN